MYVIPIFEGDVDMEVASKQHDVYPQALGIIVSKCNLYTEFARSLLNDADHPEWGTVEYFDHRTLQHAHDLLAAAWRFRNDFQQGVLPFVDKKSIDEVPTLWLDWLRHEIAGWIDYPHRVRLVQLMRRNSPSTSSTGLRTCRGTRNGTKHMKPPSQSAEKNGA